MFLTLQDVDDDIIREIHVCFYSVVLIEARWLTTGSGLDIPHSIPLFVR